jgi:endonuclease/exonuclease/phosphatase family metal-dependent hydrolase
MRQAVRIISALTLLVFPTIAFAQDIVLHAAGARVAGKWVIAPDGTAPGGQVVKHPNANAAKVQTAAAAPSNYFDVTFTATAGKPYRLWLLGRAEAAYWGNDSVYVQFSDSVTSSGSPTFRIGTTSAAEVNLEECASCGVPSGFAWQDNGYGQGVFGPLVYFAKTGTQTLRVQTREDGLAVSRILLSPSTYLRVTPPIDTGGESPGGSDIVLRADSARVAGKWVVTADSSAPSGKVVRHPNSNGAKVNTPVASPSNYFEMTFSAAAGKPYRLWILGRAQDDYWANDSVWVQFSHSAASSGSATYRIGTTSGASVNLEDCSGCGLAPRFAWQDNGYGRGALGPLVYFSQSGTQTLRVQTREDGLAIDQILLSPATYLHAAPPAPSGPTPPPAPAPPPPDDPDPPPPPATTQLKVLAWNTHHGTDTAGVCSVDRIADWIVKTGANVVALNEVEKGSGWCSGMDQPAQYLSLLRSKTGKTWYGSFAQRDGNTHGQGNLVLSLFPLEAKEGYELSGSRSVARAQMLVNGIRVNVYATHLDNESASLRMTELLELRNWADNYPEQRILAGDFNAWDGAPEILKLLEQYFDAWRVARSAGTSIGYSGNTGGATKGGARIDYVFYSRGASRLTLQQARVFNIVQSNGVSPSDHRPVLAVFEVR